MRTVKKLPEGGKPGPHGIYPRLFRLALKKSLKWPDRWVQLKTYPGDQSAYEAKARILNGDQDIPGSVENWEIVAKRVPRERRAEIGYGSELLVRWIGEEEDEGGDDAA